MTERRIAPSSIIRLNQSSGVPIAKQIIDQIKFMVEAGELRDGDKLPSSRMLASNLGINRNTVSAAYSRLSAYGYLESRHRGGMVVSGADQVRHQMEIRERALSILKSAIDECLELGLSAEDLASLAYHYGLHSERLEVKVAFVECNEERAHYFAKELSERLETHVVSLLLSDLKPDAMVDVDLILTTFYHLAEVRRLASGHVPDVVGIVAVPHIRTLVRLSQIPASREIGILYSTQEQAIGIRDSLGQAGLHNIVVLESDQEIDVSRFEVVVVPSEMPALGEKLRGQVEVVEFGNVLDEASIRMVRQVVGGIQRRKVASGAPAGAPPARAALQRGRRLEQAAAR